MSCISLASGTPKLCRIGSKAGRRLSIDSEPSAMTRAIRTMNSTKGGAAAIGAREALAGLDIWARLRATDCDRRDGPLGAVLHSMASAAKD